MADGLKGAPGKEYIMSVKLPVIYTTEIQRQWLDYNDHLNVASYVHIFDTAGETLLRTLGMGEAVTGQTGISWAVLENHITYDREVILKQVVEVGAQLLDFDHKRMHLYWEMYVSGSCGYLAATLEQMIMCINLHSRRSTNFPRKVLENINLFSQKQAGLKRPENIGRLIGIRR